MPHACNLTLEMLTHKELKSMALERPEVKKEYDRLEREFACID